MTIYQELECLLRRAAQKEPKKFQVKTAVAVDLDYLHFDENFVCLDALSDPRAVSLWAMDHIAGMVGMFFDVCTEDGDEHNWSYRIFRKGLKPGTKQRRIIHRWKRVGFESKHEASAAALYAILVHKYGLPEA